MQTLSEFFKVMITLLENAGIDYIVTGSMAVSFLANHAAQMTLI
jgi:hypothetical protein